MIRRERVSLVADTRQIVTGLLAMKRSIRRFGRALIRANDTTGDKHIERIILDCARRRLPVETTARRLMVASDIAQVLDGRWKP